MAKKSLGEQLVERGFTSIEDVAFALEQDRSNIWIFVACDRDDDGSLQLVNATGFYPDEWTAGLAGETYIRDWQEKMTDDDPPPETFAVPLFVEEHRGSDWDSYAA